MDSRIVQVQCQPRIRSRQSSYLSKHLHDVLGVEGADPVVGVHETTNWRDHSTAHHLRLLVKVALRVHEWLSHWRILSAHVVIC